MILGDDLHERARVAFPERWAPNGEALAGYPGASWEERRVAWEFGQRMAAARASADEEPEIPSATEEAGQPHAAARDARASESVLPQLKDTRPFVDSHPSDGEPDEPLNPMRPSGPDADSPYARARGDA